MPRISATNANGETSAQLRKRAKKLRKRAEQLDSGGASRWNIIADAIDLEHEAQRVERKGRGKAFRELTPERRREIARMGGSAAVAKHGLRVPPDRLKAVCSKAGKAAAAALRAMPEAERKELIRLRNAKSWETRRRRMAERKKDREETKVSLDP